MDFSSFKFYLTLKTGSPHRAKIVPSGASRDKSWGGEYTTWSFHVERGQGDTQPWITYQRRLEAAGFTVVARHDDPYEYPFGLRLVGVGKEVGGWVKFTIWK